MTGWIPVDDPPPPDDFHTWARPASPPCPDCDCCTTRLCTAAREQVRTCAELGDPGPRVKDLTGCPCASVADNPT